jgi:post-segregation antitoxin (ccd killing protein)
VTCSIDLPDLDQDSMCSALKAEGLNVATTATTGIAAEPLHGTTLHRLLSESRHGLLAQTAAASVHVHVSTGDRLRQPDSRL